MEEFKVNEFLVLRLRDQKMIISVNNKKFQQCRFLLLNIPVEKISTLKDCLWEELSSHDF